MLQAALVARGTLLKGHRYIGTIGNDIIHAGPMSPRRPHLRRAIARLAVLCSTFVTVENAVAVVEAMGAAMNYRFG